MHIFKAYDIRGVYGEDITEEVMEKIGKSIGTFLEGNKTICVGYDTRPSSLNLFGSLVTGLISTGCNVIDLGMVINPVAYFYAWKNKTYGCYITASHNPVSWNGLKIFKPDGVSFTHESKELEKIFNLGKFSLGKGKIKEERNTEDYKNFLKGIFGELKLKVVIDFLGGAGVSSLETLKEIGLDIITLHDKPDPSLYGFHRLEPWGSLLNELKGTVVREKADFGVAYDCDADRSVFIDSSGNYVDPSIINLIFIEYILKERKGKVIATYNCATETEKIVKDLDGKLIWCRIGHGFIEEMAKEEKALFAGEESSHFYFNIFYPFSDGILSTLYLSKILKESNKKLDELAARIKINPIFSEYIDAQTDEKEIKVVKRFKEENPDALDIIDGIKIKLNEVEWVLIRTSQTLPEVNLCIQAKNEERLKDLIEEYSDLIEKRIMETK